MTGEPALGLAAERTALAWQRTALALAANGVLLLVRVPFGGRAAAVLAAAALALAAGVSVVGRRRQRALRAADAPGVSGHGPVLLGATVAVLAVLVAGAVALG